MNDPAYFLNHRLPSALELLERWVNTNSYSLYPEGVDAHADQVIEAFSPLGFSATRADAENPSCAAHLFLSRGAVSEAAQAPTIAMVSHLDTVFPEAEERANQFAWKRDGDRIYGPGTWDIKGGSLMILLLLELLARFNPELFDRVHWELGFNSSEEILNPSFGRRCLERLPPETRAVLIFEGDGAEKPGDACRLIRQRKGRSCFRITVSGLGAHAGADHGAGANAIRHLARLVEPIEALTNYESGLTVNVGTIQGGVSMNRVPHHAELELEMRAPHDYLLDQAERDLGDIVAKSASVVSPVKSVETRAAVERLSQVPAFERNDGADALVAEFAAAGQGIGHEVLAQSRGGVGDINFIGARLPAIDGLGPIGQNGHASEWTDAPQVKRPEFIFPVLRYF